MIYRIVKEIVKHAAANLKKTDSIKADKLRQVSTHWFRHTSLSHQVNKGIDLHCVNKNARHA